LVVLLVAAGCLLWLSVARFGTRLGFSGLTARASFVVAYLLFQLVTVAVVELASLGHRFDTGTVRLGWGAVVVALLCLHGPGLARTARAALRDAGPRLRSAPDLDVAVVGVVLVALLALLAVMGWLYRSSNADANAYHLARVQHWLQQGSVEPFAAHFLAQVELAPLSSYQFATLELVTGTDRWAGYVALTAAVVCVLGASELARRLGLPGPGQALAALLTATLPSLVLEATSTTNNLFGASIGVGVLVVLTSGLGVGGWLSRGVALGAVAGLAELAKGTLVVLVGPAAAVLVVVALARLWRERGPRVVVRRSAAALLGGTVAAVAVAGPFLYRNLTLFGGLGGPVTDSTVVSDPSAGGAFGNVVRTVTTQFLIGGEHGPLHVVSRAVTAPLGWLYDVAGGTAGDAYVLEPYLDPFASRDYSVTSRFEDVGANPWHVVLVAVSLVVLAVAVLRGSREVRLPLALALALVVGFLGFATTAKWSIYATRYYEPLLVLWCPLIAVALSRVPWPRVARVLPRVVAALLVAAALPLLLDNYTRSLVHADWRHDRPLEAYFGRAGSADGEGARQLAADYDDLTAALAGSSCEEVGLASSILAEYPLWVGLHQHGWEGRILDVRVANVSSELEPPGFEPCAVVTDSVPLVPGAPPPPTSFPGLTPNAFGTLTLFLPRPVAQ
jgi:hypothetical protein